MGARTQGRELALQLLYQVDLLPSLTEAERKTFLDGYAESDDVRSFAEEIARGVLAHRDALDQRIAAIAENWTISRMAAVDRNILRIGAYELLHASEVPVAVALDEAVELAKKYSSKNAGAFVNGILDAIRRECERAQPSGSGAPGAAR